MKLLAVLALAVATSAAPTGHQAPLAAQASQASLVSSLTALKPAPAKKAQWPAQAQAQAQVQAQVQAQAQAQAPWPQTTHSRETTNFFKQVEQASGGERAVGQEAGATVSEDGRLLGAISHTSESRKSPGDAPHSSSSTDIEVPGLGIQGADGATAAELAGYVLETGDQASVVHFLQMLLQEGKMTEEQVLAYVDTIKKDIDVVEKERAGEEGSGKVEGSRGALQRAGQVQGEAGEDTRERAMVEEAAREAAISLEKEEEHGLILRINDYLEESLAEGRISRNLYNHLKEALIESVVDSMREGVGSLGEGGLGGEGGPDYPY